MDAASLIRQARHAAGMTQAALARGAGTSQPAVAAYESGARSPSVRTLDKLIRATGASLRIELTPASPARGQLLGELRAHQPLIRRAARRHGIRNVRVFGSAARGEETADSDVDLLVDFDADEAGLLPLASFAREVSALVQRPVDASTLSLLRPAVRHRALRDAVPL